MTDQNIESSDSLPNADSRIADASRALAKSASEELRVQLDDGSSMALPKMVKELLLTILTELSDGNMVNIVPVHAELSTQEAANLLNVSRPYLVKLLEDKKLPFHKTGSHRRVKYTDLRKYMNQQEVERQRTMEALAREAQELDLGY